MWQKYFNLEKCPVGLTACELETTLLEDKAHGELEVRFMVMRVFCEVYILEEQ